MQKIIDSVLLFLRGIGMGAADVIPGVSGGTIAFITGIYKKLVDSIKSINFGFIKLLLQKKPVAAWKHINGNFLAAVFSGVLVSVFSLAKLISWLLEYHRILVWAFFFGLIIASAIYIGRKIDKWNIYTVIFILAGAVIAFYITLATPATTPETLYHVFFSGSIAVCAMILPGISGSFILLLLGKYEYVLNAVRDLNTEIIAIFAAGCIVGLIIFSNIVSWLLKKYYDYTIAILAGLMIGSLNKLWPWKKVLKTRLNIHGEEVPLLEKNILPGQFQQIYDTGPMILPVLALMITGFILIFLINYLATVKKK